MYVLLESAIFGWDSTIWKSEVAKTNQNIEKIAFKVVQIKSLAMHITYKSLDIFKVKYVLNIFMEHNLYLMS